MWLTFNSFLFSSMTSTFLLKYGVQLLSLTPPLIWATTQTHLNDCHHFPASLPRKADTDICLSPLEGFSKSGQCTKPTLKAPAGIQTLRLTQESLSLLNPKPATWPSHISSLLLTLLPTSCLSSPCFHTEPSALVLGQIPVLAYPKMLLLPGGRQFLSALTESAVWLAPWELLITKPCAWPLDLNHSSGSVTLPKSCCLPASFLQDRRQ